MVANLAERTSLRVRKFQTATQKINKLI